MNQDLNDDGRDRRRQRAELRRSVILAAALASLAVLVAECGGGGSSAPGRTPVQQAVAYAQCMRSNGEPGFPDPDSQGLFPNLGPADVHSAKYLSATKACGHLLPTYRPSAAQRRLEFSRQLRYAACFRSHGFPDTPDPVQLPNGNIEGAGSGGAVGPGSPVNTSSPQYKSAQHACLPFLTGARS
jgi:hypothetical protein